MGAGIAEVSLQKAGHHVILKDNFTKGLSRGQDQIFTKYALFFDFFGSFRPCKT